jgi:2-polyprenyl-3-methyl-5-hydroxy-6-metoxy-1,4-benzoquinol methylase
MGAERVNVRWRGVLRQSRARPMAGQNLTDIRVQRFEKGSIQGLLMSVMAPVKMYSACPLCEGTDLRQLWKIESYSIAKCHACQLVFVLNQLTTEELSAYYASFEDEAYDESNVECLNAYYEKLGGIIRSRFPKPGKLLDVGCARGWFLDSMPDWECHGNEIAVSYAATAREKHGDRIVVGPFDQYPMLEEYFDVITLQDVFDHIRDPLPMLEKCYRLLKPGGLIAIKVHNISCLYAKLTGRNFYAMIPPSHLFYYDRQTLGLTLKKSGFQVIDSKFIGHLFKVKTVFHRLSKGNENSAYHRLYKALDHSALGEIKFNKNLHDIITMLAVKPA